MWNEGNFCKQSHAIAPYVLCDDLRHLPLLQLLFNVNHVWEHGMLESVLICPKCACEPECVATNLYSLQVSADLTPARANYQTPNGWHLVHYAAYLGVSYPALYG